MRRSNNPVKHGFLTAVLVLWSLSPLAGLPGAFASGTTITGGAPVSGSTASPLAITDLQLSATGNPTTPVKLVVSNGTLTMNTTTGLTFTGPSTGSTLAFSGTVSDINADLPTLHYTRNSGVGTDTLEVSLVGPDEVYDPANSHLYEYVTSDGSKTWTQANSLAAARTLDGLTGYLATMTSADENGYISDRLTGAGWMGANDLVTKHTWQWSDGPEAGQNFWQGLGNSGGHALNSAYTNWNNGEPNDAGGNEDCGQFLSGGSGEWNDLPCTGTTLAGYVVEYGAPGNLASVASKSVSLTVTPASDSVATCAQLEALDGGPSSASDNVTLTHDIDCTGYTVHPLFPGGFSGVFNGAGYKITNLTMNEPSTASVGLFSSANGATFENVTLSGGNIDGEYNVGALVGAATNSTISNVHSDINVDTPYYYIGGLVGAFMTNGIGSSGSITNSSSSGSVNAPDGYAGGLIGYTEADDSVITVSQSYATGDITAADGSVGGLVGFVESYGSSGNASNVFNDDYAQGDITAPGQTLIGGLIGYMQSSGYNGQTTDVTVNRTYASGTVTASTQAGGLIGFIDTGNSSDDTEEINDSFAAGAVVVDDPSQAGALIGYNNYNGVDVTSTNNYFDPTLTTLSNCNSGSALGDCNSVNTAGYFVNNHYRPPLDVWDFSSIWLTHTNGYPTFRASANLDNDGDGITNGTEDAAPNGGDANGDGIADSSQDNVTSTVDASTGQYVALQLSSACATTSDTTAVESNGTGADSGYSYPAGLLSYTADCGTNGFTATVTAYFYGLSSASFVARKYNPTSNSYSTVPGATITDVTVGGQSAVKLVYQITDGGSLDQDATANGVIVDPVGLGVNVVGAPDTGLGGLSRR